MPSATATMTKLDEPPVAAMSSLLPELSHGTFNGLPKAEPYGDFRDDLSRDGFAVIRGAIPRERADQYADKMFTYLEELQVSVSPQIEFC